MAIHTNAVTPTQIMEAKSGPNYFIKGLPLKFIL